MIKELSFFSNSKLSRKETIQSFSFGEFSLTSYFDYSDLKPNSGFEIVFSNRIVAVRNASYEWSSDFTFYVAGPLSPKILHLENDVFVQANCTLGFWEIDSENPCKLLWNLNPDKSRVLTQYEGEKDFKALLNIPVEIQNKELKLLFTNKKPLEWSRSKIPFSAIACFTDHCDFDTSENLKLQRKLFKETGVRVTKGIFLSQFSKRDDNASWENDAEELQKWEQDGHELAYHSLSQSLRNEKEGFSEFQNFVSPLPNMTTWIDHGFQPYNLSLIQKKKIAQEAFFSKMHSQQISNFWNYIDSGTATRGVLNQLNLEHFTLNAFYKGLKKTSFKDKVGLMVKDVFFHFYANEEIISTYKTLAAKVKKVIMGRKINQIPGLFKATFKVVQPIFSVVLRWGKSKKIIYPLAKYNPVLFSFKLNGNKMVVFQTLEMLDFKNALSPEMLDVFSKEKGFFIAHTYFSVPMKYHKGRMFLKASSICAEVAQNFNYLGKLVKEEKVWNPTLRELSVFLEQHNDIEFMIDKEGNIMQIGDVNFFFRAC